MYSLYKDPSGEINLDLSNITTNLSGMHTRGNNIAKKVNPKMCITTLHSSDFNNALYYTMYVGQGQRECRSGFQFKRSAQ